MIPNNQLTFRVNLVKPSGEVREVKKGNKTYLVAPFVAAVEGVLNEWLVTSEALKNSASYWNGVPLVINHPEDGDGVHCSIHQGDLLATLPIGTFEKSTYNDQLKALTGELWIDLKKAKAAGEDGQTVVERLRKLEPLEVSTGYFVPQMEVRSGSHNGKAFSEVHHAIDPDHMALLPNATGACSWRDGCGAPRVHSEKHGPECEAGKKLVTNQQTACTCRGTTNMEKKAKVDALIANAQTRFAEADRDWLMKLEDNQLDNLQPVEPKKEEKPVINAQEREAQVKVLIDAAQYTADDKGWLMTCEQTVFDKLNAKAMVAIKAIVDNANNKISKAIGAKRFKEEDRSWLVTLNEEALDRVLAEPAKVEPPKKAPTVEEYLQAAPDEVKTVMTAALDLAKENRAKVLTALKANTRCALSEQEMSALPTSTLEKLAQSYEMEDYAGGSGGNHGDITDNDDQNSVPPPPSGWMTKRPEAKQ